MEQQVIDRRCTARFPASAYGAARATLRPGCVVHLVDISAAGTLVEGTCPLRPGARVHLQVVHNALSLSVTARVMRSVVWSLDPLDGVRYRGALKFDRMVDWDGNGSG